MSRPAMTHQNQIPPKGRWGQLLSWMGLTTTPSVLLALLLAGWPSTAKANVTVVPDYVCQGQTVDVTLTSNITPGNRFLLEVTDTTGTVAYGTNYTFVNSEGNPISLDDFTERATRQQGSAMITIRVQNISAEGEVSFEDTNGSYKTFSLNFYPSTHASCATAATDGVTLSETTLALTELGAANLVEKTYTVVLDTNPTADVTITVANGDATAVAVDTDSGTSGNQNTLTFTAGGDGSGSGAGNGNWATAQTVTVRALNDPDGANESFNLTHTATATGSTAPYDGITIGTYILVSTTI